MAVLARVQKDASASAGIRFRIVMLQWNAQMTAHIGQGRRVQSPNRPSHFNRANKCGFRRFQRGLGATGLEHRTIESGVMGRNEINPLQLRLNFTPQFLEARFAFYIAPGNAMEISECEVLSRWSNEPRPS